MNVIFCVPELTMADVSMADNFYKECVEILQVYVADVKYIKSNYQINQLLSQSIDKNDILVFFTSENGVYSDEMCKLIKIYAESETRIWAVAMKKDPECRKTPEPITNKQSFDVASRQENRNPLKNNLKAIAQLFARKIIAQILSPLYRDEVLYFISHRRIDGEHIAARLADGLTLLTRERNVYRDVVNVKVGDDAQKDIDEHLSVSDVVIFLQTEQAQYSPYIMKELCYALVNDIPILWIQIDDASYDKMEIHPGEGPALRYCSKEFDSNDRLEEIVDEVEDKCFELMMNSSNQVYSYVEYLNEMVKLNKIKLNRDDTSILAYYVEYKEKTRDLYDRGIRKHYIQCFGRNPKETDINDFIKRVNAENKYKNNDKIFLLSNHGSRDKYTQEEKVIEENYDDYFMNLENVFGTKRIYKNKRIVLSGAFPDCDEIYKASLLEALVVYSREIIKRGYTLVFGAHPTFQKIIFEIGNIYSSDVKKSIIMYIAEQYIGQYNMEELEEECTLVVDATLDDMRNNMIGDEQNEMLICLGGKIKEEKSQQGVDIEIGIAQAAKIPVALVGTVGGRSSEYAYEKIEEGDWSELNPWGNALNEELFYNMNHRLMIQKLLNKINNKE